jgi:CBS domain-containing protein
MRIEQLMSRDVKICFEHDTLNHAAELMWNHDCGFLPVVRDQTSRVMTGVITDRDIAMAAYTQGKTLSEIPVSVAMARGVKVCHPSDEVGTAQALMRLKQVHRLPVVDHHGRVVGVVSLNDIAQSSQSSAQGLTRIPGTGVAETLAAVSQPREKGGSTVERDYIE